MKCVLNINEIGLNHCERSSMTNVDFYSNCRGMVKLMPLNFFNNKPIVYMYIPTIID